MCWELTVTSQNRFSDIFFQFSDIPTEIKENRGDYYGRSLGYEINSCSRPEVLLADRQIFVWGDRREHDNDILNLPRHSFITLVNILSGNTKVKIKGVDRFCIGGC